MEFIKKILVLKQVSDGYAINGKTVSGILRLETESGVTTLYLSVINLSAAGGGTFRLYFTGHDKKLFGIDLGKRPFSITKTLDFTPDLEKGISAGLSYVCDGLPVLVAFSRTENSKIIAQDLKKMISEKCMEERKLETDAKLRAEKLSGGNEKIPMIQHDSTSNYTEKAMSACGCADADAPLVIGAAEYDDEAVATENYYDRDALSEKLKIIERFDSKNVRNEDDVSAFGSQKKENQNRSDSYGFPNEADFGGGENYNENSPYYDTVREELNDIMEKFPSEERLELNIPFSKWARINYSEEKYYVVGLVSEDNKEKYICYGVPAKYSADPPKELKGFCSFVPLSVFDLKGDGYWMMFQDAVTGECIRLNE